MSGRCQWEGGADPLFVGEIVHCVVSEFTNAISFAHSVAFDSNSEETVSLRGASAVGQQPPFFHVQ
jgi:hypothetical protein